MEKNFKIAIAGGARPNFMKVAALCREFNERGMDHFLVNTGQHFDPNMSADFFREFKINFKYNLKLRKKLLMEQFSAIMVNLEKILFEERPELVIVVGDVNSTLASALVANKMNIKLAHIEAGLRSRNKKMSEETNRILTDHMADFLFVTTEEGMDNLSIEGIEQKAYFVGNTMIDTLVAFLPEIPHLNEDYYFCTLHRAENVDDKKVFLGILDALEVISKDEKIYLPLHPRTKKMAEKFNFIKRMRKIFKLIPPLNYKESITYQKSARLVLTDSGGVQEETTFLGVPCITLRTETERPITVKSGTNTVAGIETNKIIETYRKKSLKKCEKKIKLWDGNASERIVNILQKNFGQ